MFISIGQKRAKAPPDLVDLLLECHERIRHFIALAQQLGLRDDVPVAEVVEGCQRCERYFEEALPLHVLDEEESLLPRLQGLRSDLDAALTSMHDEHLAHEQLLAALLTASRALRERPGDSACRDELGRAAARLNAELGQHLAREEELIFPAVRTLLSPLAQSEALDELRRRRGTSA